MQFPKRSAMNIVQEIGDVIGEKINMMDSEGVIIASTDPARMKTFHAGAKKLVEERLDELVVRYDGEFDGARHKSAHHLRGEDRGGDRRHGAL